jgi:hypothetical protein
MPYAEDTAVAGKPEEMQCAKNGMRVWMCEERSVVEIMWWRLSTF